MKYWTSSLLSISMIPVMVSGMDALKLQAYGMDLCNHEKDRLIKTYGMSPQQAESIAATKFSEQVRTVPLSFPSKPTDTLRVVPPSPSRNSFSEEIKAKSHLKEVTMQEAEYTKRQTACYAATSAVISALLTAGVTLAIHFSECK